MPFGCAGKALKIHPQNCSFLEADVNVLRSEQICGKIIEKWIMPDQQQRLFVAMRADLLPYFFDRRTWSQRFRSKYFVLIFQDILRDFGGLDCALERTAQNESWFNSSLGCGLENRLQFPPSIVG